MTDEYQTIAGPAEGELKVLGSRFLSYAAPVLSKDQALAFVEGFRKKYFDATHHCYAFRLGIGGEDFRANDDGEPAGSAGKPILAAIDKVGVTDVVVVVVRYFGGTKLGVGGLARAYGGSAELALGKAAVEQRYCFDRFVASFPHTQVSPVMRAIARFGARIVDTQYDEEVHLTIDIRRSKHEELVSHLVDQTRGNVDIRAGN